MNKHIEKAMELRNETPMVNNCAQTIMRVYADELGIDENLCAAIGCNFGGGMKCGGTCGAITAGLMVLGAKGVDSPMAVYTVVCNFIFKYGIIQTEIVNGIFSNLCIIT